MTNEPSEMSAEDRFYMMMGRCIAEWARVDDELYRIFEQCLGPPKQSAILYFKMPGLEVRMTTTREIVLSVLPEREKKDGGHDHPSVKSWKAIEKRFKKLLPVRRRIAHLPVGQGRVPRYFAARYFRATSLSKAGPHTIEASANEKLRGRDTDNKQLTLDDLTEHLSSLGRLIGSLQTFRLNVLPDHT